MLTPAGTKRIEHLLSGLNDSILKFSAESGIPVHELLKHLKHPVGKTFPNQLPLVLSPQKEK